MFYYRKAILAATYKNGIPGKLTEEHEKAESHPFTTDFLFKDTIIPKNLYISRLIQHFLIIKAIETQLQRLPRADKLEINTFFSLAYLEHLWRTPAIQKDLQQLEVDPEEIDDEEVALSTDYYIKKIQQLTPKDLLAHFLFHIADFMQGGDCIRSKYIEPSNHLTSYQIPINQYDFSLAAEMIGDHSPIQVLEHMMGTIDGIGLNSDEYQSILEQGQSLYKTMYCIYDDLHDMHAIQPQLTQFILTSVGVALAVVAIILRPLIDYITPPQDYSDSPRPG